MDFYYHTIVSHVQRAPADVYHFMLTLLLVRPIFWLLSILAIQVAVVKGLKVKIYPASLG